MKRASPRQEKIAAAWDTDVWPLGPARAAEAILRALPRQLDGRILEVGCGSGRMTLAVAERLTGAGRITALDGSPAMIERAVQARARHPSLGEDKVAFQLGDLGAPLPFDDDTFDLALANLALGEATDPVALLTELGRALKPGGRALVTLPLRGCWSEFLDLYRDVLGEPAKREALAVYQAGLPDPAAATSWLGAADLADPGVETLRWELLFKSAREFFFAPIIEFFPLPAWKQIAGGRGDEMQDVFFFVKESIETYFAGMVFPVTMVVGLLSGTKRAG